MLKNIEQKSKRTFREKLLHNKIYFEVTASVLIGGASLVVSWSAFKINERMLVATEISALPHFSIGKRARVDPNSNAYVEETIFLSNNGAPVSNVNWRVKTFIVVDRSTPTKRYVLVPLNGYYFAQYRSSAVTGELSSIVGHENKAKFSRLYKESLASNSSRTDNKFAFLQETTVSVVHYEDRFGRQAVAYFHEYSKVSEESVLPLLEYKQTTPPLDIDHVTLGDVLSRAAMPDALILDRLP